MGIERHREIRRRRKRKQKLAVYKRRVKSASAAEKAVIARKLRMLTPGADSIIESLGIQDR
jgi:hypothetical protein